jgi:DNA segregation ATPase FtsK/SpoIIIE-like protein
VKANLETRIAFAVTDRFESDIILDRQGAEKLGQVGLCLTNAGAEWRKVQAAYIPERSLGEWLHVGDGGPVLTEIEAELVRYAVEELDGAFTLNTLYDAQERGELNTGERLSRYALGKLAKSWERREWLTEPTRNDQGHKIGRLVTPELAKLANCATEAHRTTHGTPTEPTERHGTHGTTERQDPPRVGGGDGEIPAFLASRPRAEELVE